MVKDWGETCRLIDPLVLEDFECIAVQMMKWEMEETWLSSALIELPAEMERDTWTLIPGPRRKSTTTRDMKISMIRLITYDADFRAGNRRRFRSDPNEDRLDCLHFVSKTWRLQVLVKGNEVVLEGLEVGKG